MNKKINIEQFIIKIILLFGITLSIIQYIYNRSLWLDEAMLAINIHNRNFIDLFKNLTYNQVAPILFLQLEKIFSILIPNSEYGLRLLPLLCFLLGLFLFYKIIKLIFINQLTIIFALSIFVFNSSMMYYSNEVKQYMCDVLVLMIIYYFILKKYKNEKNKFIYIGIFGVLSIFFSNASPVILFSSGLYLIFNYFINEKIYLKNIIIVFFVWFLTFLFFYTFFIHSHPTKEFMLVYWSKANAFMPINPLSTEIYIFIANKSRMIFSSLLFFSNISLILFTPFFLLGIFILFKRNLKKEMLILTISPIIIHLLLSSLKLYPFDLRFILYLLPLFIIIISYGFEYFTNLGFYYFNIIKFRFLAILIPVLFILMFLRDGFPKERHELKKSITFIQKHLENNDRIYIYYGASVVFNFYHDIGYIKETVPIEYGSINYINELKELKGNYWLLFSRVSIEEENNIINMLDLLGHNKIAAFNTNGSSTYLYNFKD